MTSCAISTRCVENILWCIKKRYPTKQNSVFIIYFLRLPFVSSCPKAEAASVLISDFVGVFFPDKTFDASEDTLFDVCFFGIVKFPVLLNFCRKQTGQKNFVALDQEPAYIKNAS
jgi:hypothetical protein